VRAWMYIFAGEAPEEGRIEGGDYIEWLREKGTGT
jgi:gamma-glutamylcyclotransferase (GGCT)/AIG2-like uncharacterized protein YtfP